MQLAVWEAICITAPFQVPWWRTLNFHNFLIEWTFSSPKLNLQKACKHIWKGSLQMMGMFELMICGLGSSLQDNSSWKRSVRCVSKACGVGWDWGLIFPCVCMCQVLQGGGLWSWQLMFCSNNARANGFTDTWEGRAVAKSTQWSRVTSAHVLLGKRRNLQAKGEWRALGIIRDFTCGQLLDQLGESGGNFCICRPVNT